jgi:hypothetical protein
LAWVRTHPSAARQNRDSGANVVGATPSTRTSLSLRNAVVTAPSSTVTEGT